MRAIESSYLAVVVVGAVHAVRLERPVRFAGINLQGTPRHQALTVGTPLSAPPVLLAVLLVASRRGRNDIVRMLAMLFLLGTAGEVDTWTALRNPTVDLLATACVLLDVVLPAAMVWETK